MTNNEAPAVKYRPARALDKLKRKLNPRTLPNAEDLRGYLIRVPVNGTHAVVVPIERLDGFWKCIVVSDRALIPVVLVSDSIMASGVRLLTEKQLWDTPADAGSRPVLSDLQGAILRVDDLIVVPVCQVDDGWDCVVIGGEKPLTENPYFVYVHKAVLAAVPLVFTESGINAVPSPPQQAFVLRGCEDLLPLATEFTILPAGAIPGEPDLDTFSIKLAWRGPNQWAVTWIGRCWGREGWISEPGPSLQDADFVANCRYPLERAARIARRLVDDLEIDGMTWARIRSQRG